VFVLSGRGLCEGPIPRPEESYRLWCVSECDQVKIKPPCTCCEQVGRRGKDCETKRNHSNCTSEAWIGKPGTKHPFNISSTLLNSTHYTCGLHADHEMPGSTKTCTSLEHLCRPSSRSSNFQMIFGQLQKECILLCADEQLQEDVWSNEGTAP
jgi:hypothetical protein